MRALFPALLLLSIAAPAAAQDAPRQTQSTTTRAGPPPGFSDAVDRKDYQGAFILLAPAIVACVKAQSVQDECLDLLLVGTTIATRAEALDVAETLAEQAAKVADASLPDTDTDRLTAAQNMAAVLDQLKRPADAIPWHRKAVTLAERQLAPGDPAIGRALTAIASGLDAGKDFATQEAAQRRLLAWRERFEPQNVATSHADLALAIKQQGRLDDAEAEYAIAQRLMTAQFGADHQYSRTIEYARIDNLQAAGRRKEMLPLLIARAARLPADFRAMRWLGQMQQALGDYPAAEASYRRAVAVLRSDPKADPAFLADSLAGVAAALDARDRSAEAEATLREALAVLPRTPDQKYAEFKLLNNLAGSVMSQGRYAEAEAIYRGVVAGRRGGDPLDLALALSNLSVALTSLDRLAEAAQVQAEATALRRANLPADDQMIALSESIQAGIEEERNGYPAGLALRRSAYAIYRKALGPDHPRTAGAAQALALALAHTRTDLKLMNELLVEARAVMSRLDPDSYNRIVNGSYLAVSYLGVTNPDADPARARTLLIESIAGIQARVARFRDFGPAAQMEMRSYGPIFNQQVQAAWELSRKAK